MDAAVEDTAVVEDRPGSNALNRLVVAFGPQFGRCSDADWALSSALLLRLCWLNY